jgi:UDP-N-acetyl-D-mannosaminuronic acid dehydrogenase
MRVAVVGLGYVGLPMACVFADRGDDVVGIDIDRSKVDAINRGVLPVEGDEPGLEELFKRVLKEGKLTATTDFSACRDSDAITLGVETPVDDRNRPAYDALRAAVTSVGQNLTRGTLVVIESTVAPGTTQGFVAEVLEAESGLKAGTDFHLAHCPERLQAGKLLKAIREYDRVIGGVDEESTRRALALYGGIGTGALHPTDALTAEVAKTAENAYRDVHIGFANEVALLCEAMGVDAYEARELVNTAPFRDMHVPGAGVGGHCIPKDPWLLLHGAGDRVSARVIPAARAVNDAMPHHMARLVQEVLKEAGRGVEGSRVVILGVAYRPNTGDFRNSPALPLAEALRAAGAEVALHDPLARKSGVEGATEDLWGALEGADCAALVTAHREYRTLDLERLREAARTPALVDGRNLWTADAAARAGVLYRGIGKGR